MKREWTYQYSISSPLDDETGIRNALARAILELAWDQGDSSWDKVRVWGAGDGAKVLIYRYESPGPFALTVTVSAAAEDEAQRLSLALRDQVLTALRVAITLKGG